MKRKGTSIPPLPLLAPGCSGCWRWLCFAVADGSLSWLILTLSELACFIFRSERHRQKNALMDEREAI